jgi:hypothetical protein
VTRATLADDSDRLMTSANEIRRMFTTLSGLDRDEQNARRWSRWRHRHPQRTPLPLPATTATGSLSAAGVLATRPRPINLCNSRKSTIPWS